MIEYATTTNATAVKLCSYESSAQSFSSTGTTSRFTAGSEAFTVTSQSGTWERLSLTYTERMTSFSQWQVYQLGTFFNSSSEYSDSWSRECFSTWSTSFGSSYYDPFASPNQTVIALGTSGTLQSSTETKSLLATRTYEETVPITDTYTASTETYGTFWDVSSDTSLSQSVAFSAPSSTTITFSTSSTSDSTTTAQRTENWTTDYTNAAGGIEVTSVLVNEPEDNEILWYFTATATIPCDLSAIATTTSQIIWTFGSSTHTTKCTGTVVSTGEVSTFIKTSITDDTFLALTTFLQSGLLSTTDITVSQYASSYTESSVTLFLGPASSYRSLSMWTYCNTTSARTVTIHTATSATSTAEITEQYSTTLSVGPIHTNASVWTGPGSATSITITYTADAFYVRTLITYNHTGTITETNTTYTGFYSGGTNQTLTVTAGYSTQFFNFGATPVSVMYVGGGGALWSGGETATIGSWASEIRYFDITYGTTAVATSSIAGYYVGGDGDDTYEVTVYSGESTLSYNQTTCEYTVVPVFSYPVINYGGTWTTQSGTETSTVGPRTETVTKESSRSLLLRTGGNMLPGGYSVLNESYLYRPGTYVVAEHLYGERHPLSLAGTESVSVSVRLNDTEFLSYTSLAEYRQFQTTAKVNAFGSADVVSILYTMGNSWSNRFGSFRSYWDNGTIRAERTTYYETGTTVSTKSETATLSFDTFTVEVSSSYVSVPMESASPTYYAGGASGRSDQVASWTAAKIGSSVKMTSGTGRGATTFSTAIEKTGTDFAGFQSSALTMYMPLPRIANTTYNPPNHFVTVTPKYPDYYT